MDRPIGGFIFADEMDIVLHGTGRDAGIAARTAVQVNDHAPFCILFNHLRFSFC